MCYYNTLRVSRADYITLLGFEKDIRNMNLNRPAYNAFNYRDWPIVKPILGGEDFEIKEAHWEYIPASVHDDEDLKKSRYSFDWLNARAENLFKNERGGVSMWREGALHGRCLFLMSGFFEYRHFPKIGKIGANKGKVLKTTETVPYYVTLRSRPEIFLVAGISRVWTNYSRGQSADTAALLTTEANYVMQQIHNAKKRMPTILPEHLAAEWIQDGLSEQRIKEIASYQYRSEEMEAWTVAKDFLKTADDPLKEVPYSIAPPLTYAA